MRGVVKIAVRGKRRCPLDGMPAPTAAYSFRQLRTGYTAGKAFNVVRASDSGTKDIGFGSNGLPDIDTLNTFLAGTTGKVVTMYDQSGGGRDITQATDANRPPIVLAGAGGVWPCMQFTANTMTLAAGSNITPATGMLSLAAVAIRTAGTGACHIIRENAGNNRMITRSGATGWSLAGGTSGFLNTTSAENVWHAALGTIDAGASAINVDGAEAGPGTSPTGNTTAGAPGILGAASTTVNIVEGIIWDNITVIPGDRSPYVAGARAALRL